MPEQPESPDPAVTEPEPALPDGLASIRDRQNRRRRENIPPPLHPRPVVPLKVAAPSPPAEPDPEPPAKPKKAAAKAIPTPIALALPTPKPPAKRGRAAGRQAARSDTTSTADGNRRRSFFMGDDAYEALNEAADRIGKALGGAYPKNRVLDALIFAGVVQEDLVRDHLRRAMIDRLGSEG